MIDREELRSRGLKFVAKRGYIGASKDDLIREFRGVSYEQLEDEMKELEKEGYLTITWIGDTNFVAMTTEKGKKATE